MLGYDYDVFHHIGAGRYRGLTRHEGQRMIDSGQTLTMSDTVNIGINTDQRELILRGLRFVRSSVLLRTVDNPGDDDTTQRETELREIENLVEQLAGAPTTAGV